MIAHLLERLARRTADNDVGVLCKFSDAIADGRLAKVAADGRHARKVARKRRDGVGVDVGPAERAITREAKSLRNAAGSAE